MITEALKHNVKIKQKGKMNITQVFELCCCVQPSQTSYTNREKSLGLLTALSASS